MEWQSSFELGVEDIDLQHRFFLGLINRVQTLLERASTAEEQSRLVAELNAYAKFHFLSEENLMRRAGFPGVDEHHRHHIDLIEKLSLRQGMVTLRHTDVEIREIVEFLVHWFVAHTQQEDRVFADFVHGR